MPFGPFAKKFSPKKPGPRKAVSLSTLQNLDRETLQRELTPDDIGQKIKINLDGNRMYFDGKDWVSGIKNHAQLQLNSNFDTRFNFLICTLN